MKRIQDSMIPSRWAKVRLSEILPLSYGKGLTGGNRDNQGMFCVFGSSGVIGHHSKALTSGSTLIVGRKGSVGEVHYSSDPCWPIDTTYFVEGAANINLQFFYYLLKKVNLRNLDKSTAVPGLSRDDYNKVEVAIAPFSEQQRIVDEIEKQFTRLDSAVNSLKRVKANLKRYRATVLKAACEGRLVPTEAELAQKEGRSYEPADVLLKRILKERRAKWEADQLAQMKAKGKSPKDDKWKEKYKEPAQPDTANLSKLPEGWLWITLPQIGEVNRGKSKHRPRNDPKLYNGPYPFLQTSDVKHSGGLIRSHSQTYNEAGLKQSRLWPAGTLCITIAANIADTGILTYPACFPDSIIGFKFSEEPFALRYIEMFFRNAKEHISRFAPATAQKNVNLEIISNIGIPFPPLSEQKRIVEEVDRHISVIDELDTLVDLNLKKADRLRQSILKRAFEGKLVPQDPKDEPASVLLDRIREEHIKSADKTKPKAKTKRQKQKVK